MNELDSIRIMTESDETKQEIIQADTSPCGEWKEYDSTEKKLFIFKSFAKFIILLFLLYLFLIILELITIAVILITPAFLKYQNVLKNLFSDPITALCLGILTTSILQNAAATTSIIITMVGTGLISSVKNAIPAIMGSNIGTCVTSSYVALTLSNNSLSLGRAFAAATLNDMFNILTTLILLPSEIFFDILSSITEKIIKLINFEEKKLLKDLNIIGKIQTPFTNLLIQIDKSELDRLDNRSTIALRYCGKDGSNFTEECSYLAMPLVKNYGDNITGFIILIASTLLLLIIFFCIVKVLSLIITGPIALWVSKAINAEFSGKYKWLMHLILFLFAFLVTLIVQSSNLITATLVPLCGIGAVSLQRVYVMIMGSNVGTTVTGILSALSQPGCTLKKSLQLALVYTLFNLLGVILWLPIPFLRLPKRIAKNLGNQAFIHHWFIIAYISLFYYITPLIILLISLLFFNYRIIIILLIVVVCLIVFLVYILVIRYCFVILPERLKNFFTFKSIESLNFHKKLYESKYGRVLRRLSFVEKS